MLPRALRLTRSSDIQDTVSSGRRFSTPYTRVYFRYSNLGQPRVACVVGKKVDQLATNRHKYQRWLREIIKDLLPALPPLDIVLVGQPSLKNQNITYQDLKSSLASLPAKLNNK